MSCAVCDELFDDSSEIKNIQEKGMRKFIEVSKERGDSKWQVWENLKTIKVHEECRKIYTKPTIVAAAKRRKLMYPETNFGFATLCFICGRECNKSIENKKPKHRRRKIFAVSSGSSLKQKILGVCSRISIDPEAQLIRNRIEFVDEDLSKVGAQYHFCCLNEFMSRGIPRKKPCTNSNSLKKIFEFIDHSEDCQWDIADLLQISDDPDLSVEILKKNLTDEYGEKIQIRKNSEEVTMVSYIGEGNEELENYFTQNLPDATENELNSNIIKRAAQIIREDIRKEEYNLHVYPPATDFFNAENIDDVIPASLKLLLNEIILKKKKNIESSSRKIIGIAHAIISATRPSSFLSSLLLSLSLYIHTKFQSKQLVNLLNRLGFSSSYTEVKLFEGSAVMSTKPQVQATTDSFVQYIFDNADHDVNTVDGKNTFHCTGGVECITPRDSVQKSEAIVRLTPPPTAQQLAEKNHIALYAWGREDKPGLSAISIEDIEQLRSLESKETFLLAPELTWICGKWLKVPEHPGFSAFLEMRTKTQPFKSTMIKFLPFIYLKATDPDALYSAMLYGIKEARKIGQEDVFFTFDQQLYVIARSMVATVQESQSITEMENMKSVFIRLGGFHLIMSFLGCIGNIMAGSGLKELWSLIYAEKSLDKMLLGKNYARSIRAHTLTEVELIKILLDECSLSSVSKEQLTYILGPKNQSPTCNESPQSHELSMSTLHELENFPDVQFLISSFHDHLKVVAARGKTAALWVQYIKMVSLAKTFIYAERMGNWELHLSTIIEMIPYFHATKHLNYAKCAHLYVQDMLQLEKKMSSKESFINYTKRGYFTIRRTEKFYSGTSTDMIIEQTLMRSMHSVGGLTHGRGITESVASTWTSSVVCCAYPCDALEVFCGLSSEHSEQHKDFRESTIKRDKHDSEIIRNWFQHRSPFPDTKELISLSTGIVGGPEINCWDAERLGKQAYQEIIPKTKILPDGSLEMVKKNFKDIKLTHKFAVLDLGVANGSVKLHENQYPVSESTIFNRFLLLDLSNDSLLEYLSHELCPYPIALFDSFESMRKSKDDVTTFFKPCQMLALSSCKYIVDADVLLTCVTWPNSVKFSDLLNQYTEYLCQKYRNQVIVIFESQKQPSDHPKHAQIHRETLLTRSPTIFPTANMTTNLKRDHFLSNIDNKERFKTLLATHFLQQGIKIKICTSSDIDTFLVDVAIIESQARDTTVIIVSDSFDILFVLLAFTDENSRIYVQRSNNTWFNCSENYSKYSNLKEKMLCIHAFTGCRTTSSIFKRTKKMVLADLQKKKNDNISRLMNVFINPSSTLQEIIESGEKILLHIYKVDDSIATSLDSLRLVNYVKYADKKNKKKNLSLTMLPPTSASARFHSARVYWQVQSWLRNELPPTLWGWYLRNGMLFPIQSSNSHPAPLSLLEVMTCGCKNCSPKTCSCFKAGIPCSYFCKICEGKTCRNRNPEYTIEPEQMSCFNYTVMDDFVELDELTLNEDIYNIPQNPQPGPSSACF